MTVLGDIYMHLSRLSEYSGTIAAQLVQVIVPPSCIVRVATCIVLSGALYHRSKQVRIERGPPLPPISQKFMGDPHPFALCLIK
jgi:hypothetical protein